ncbi:MAG TPA: glycosyltransferase family 1 protein [Magnetospirillum sp.]|nr:glycosyltransferase family 1 protein [Magnetospirillum sp.]
MRIVIVSDAWKPQVNGVVRTLSVLVGELEKTGHAVTMITPDRFRTMPCPTYPEIRLSLFPGHKLSKLIEDSQPCAIHIATEGPLGWAARKYCRARKLPYTTAYHTRFPEYVRARFGVPVGVSYAVMRRFHGPAASVMVATPTIEAELNRRGFKRIRRWSRGVDTDLFNPAHAPVFEGLPRPIFLSVGRVAVEKNLDAFLSLDLPGTKVVVGDGPQRASLQARFPDAVFVGAKHGKELAAHYADADVFVFPSRTDTFGLVLLEALACGLPVAAYPVAGPLDVIDDPQVGILHEDLGQAARMALSLSHDHCRAFAARYSWQGSARQFLDNLQPFN